MYLNNVHLQTAIDPIIQYNTKTKNFRLIIEYQKKDEKLALVDEKYGNPRYYKETSIDKYI